MMSAAEVVDEVDEADFAGVGAAERQVGVDGDELSDSGPVLRGEVLDQRQELVAGQSDAIGQARMTALHGGDPQPARRQLALDRRQFGQRRRADIRALRVAEEDQRDLALEVGKHAPLAVGVGQRQLARVVRAGDVHGLEGFFLRPQAVAAAQQAGIQPPDELVAVAGTPVDKLIERRRTLGPGAVRLTVRQKIAEECGFVIEALAD